MPRPIPRCALCGGKLTYKDRVTVRFNLKGRPEIGWHIECAKKDMISPFGDDDPYEDERSELLKKIEERGEDRVIKMRRKKGEDLDEYRFS